MKKLQILIFGLLLMFLSGACSLKADKSDTLTVDIAHPALNEGKPQSCLISQILGSNGYPQEYYLDVDSVVCGDNVCEIIKVRIYWDALGGYLRYELPKGGKLTKMGHKPFNEADRQKLNMILADPNSPLRKFDPDSLSLTGDESDVDAVTKPTPLFYQNSVVKGAIYTCYTLWHWVNGDAPAKIRALTAQACSREQLMHYVAEGPERFFMFAVNQLAERRVFDKKTADAVILRAKNDRAFYMQGAIGYFERALENNMSEFYFDAMISFFADGNSQQRTLILRSLGKVGQNGPAEFYNKLAVFLPALESYFEVHLLLNIIEKHDPGSEETLKQVEKVLNNDNFLIARRAYWFLEKRKLNESLAKAVEAFRVKYESRL